MLLAVLDLVLLFLLVPLFFNLDSRDLSCARQSRTIHRARVYLGLESYAITRNPSLISVSSCSIIQIFIEVF